MDNTEMSAKQVLLHVDSKRLHQAMQQTIEWCGLKFISIPLLENENLLLTVDRNKKIFASRIEPHMPDSFDGCAEIIPTKPKEV